MFPASFGLIGSDLGGGGPVLYFGTLTGVCGVRFEVLTVEFV